MTAPPKAAPNVPMSAVGKTLIFPREDTVYKTKESIGYDEIQTKVWVERPKRRQREHLKEWLAYTLLGLFLGIAAFIMSTLEEWLSGLISHNTNHFIQANLNTESDFKKYVGPWLFFAGSSGMLGLLAGIMTTYWGPGAAGSGVAEMIGYVNGVNYPEFISIPTLITKMFGVTIAVVGRLCVGKEGPLAHIGSNLGLCVLYLPHMGFEFLQNDEKRRVFVAAGASAGVSVAFGAPIGGTLFSYEMSRPNTFWRFSMIWKVFMACALGTFFLALLENVAKGNLTGNWSGSTLKFGSLHETNDINALYLLPCSVVLGIVGGCLGSFFISVNTKMAVVRKKLLTTKWIKPVETFCWAFVTASFFYWMPYWFGNKHCANYNYSADNDETDDRD